MKTRTKRILWLTPVAVAAVYAVAVAGVGSEPAGYVASSIIGHGLADVLDFSGGTVTLRTCCGDESWGTYSRLPDGRWIWHIQVIKTAPPVMDFLVRPSLFSMSLTDAADPSKHYVLRRRVFKRWPI